MLESWPIRVPSVSVSLVSCGSADQIPCVHQVRNWGGAIRTGTDQGHLMKVTLSTNGRTVDLDVDDPNMPLLYALRNDLGLRGPRFGCGLAQCGACTVHIDGQAVRSCVTPISTVANR